MRKNILALVALLASGALAACGGPAAAPPTSGTGVAAQPVTGGMLVGIGDSLTAGYQSDGFLGDPTATNTNSGYPNHAVPPGQESGWWALMYNQMTGTANSAAAVLPLIKAPGLGSQIVIGTTAANLLYTTHSPCDAFNDQAFSASSWQNTRMNPSAGIADLGVPGITMHEAVAMSAPLTGPPSGTTCGYATLANDPTSGGLQSLVSGESGLFYPVLGGFQSALGHNLTMLNAALSLSPQLTTVWLGANDLLKFSFSAGKSPVSDTPQQMATDLTQIVTSLTKQGSKVLVADLPDVLTTPQFFPQAKLSADLQALGIPAAAAGAIVSYVGTTYGVTAGGYLTESGFLAIVTGCNTAPATCVTPALDPSGPGSGLGGAYLTPAFAAQVQALNTAYNNAIDTVATSSGSKVALVPIHATFTTIAASGYTVPGTPFPPFTLNFGGGLVSWDGLHPSNLGYAVLANAFIQTADTAFGMTIPQIAGAALAQIAINDPYDSYAIKTVNPAFPFPLP
jgi:lysophospholipase L1-like esterase